MFSTKYPKWANYNYSNYGRTCDKSWPYFEEVRCGMYDRIIERSIMVKWWILWYDIIMIVCWISYIRLIRSHTYYVIYRLIYACSLGVLMCTSIIPTLETALRWWKLTLSEWFMVSDFWLFSNDTDKFGMRLQSPMISTVFVWAASHQAESSTYGIYLGTFAYFFDLLHTRYSSRRGLLGRLRQWSIDILYRSVL